ncbi:uncharacterized protein LOC112454810 [Temnothorax curvispinosus]|uniref:Uncharacterized protein LOC112454810 n=1 Tax=Temnothorax curvispinosus TaxID=300111 RepID=A0A6J1PQW3_9HYME|nr:uncharacterized protein LOC112454810 [Temnothorax curvispinosus]
MGIVIPRARAALRLQERETLFQEWSEKLLDLRLVSGRRVREAVQPVLRDWVARKGRGLTFYATQMLTGHGCFGEYLCRIGKERTTGCHHCPEEVNSAQHTLEYCPAWKEKRRVLRAAIGNDLSPQAILLAAVGPRGEDKWKAFASFCGRVMSQKKAAERVKRGEVTPPDSEDSGGDGQSPSPRRQRLRCGVGDRTGGRRRWSPPPLLPPSA